MTKFLTKTSLDEVKKGKKKILYTEGFDKVEIHIKWGSMF